MNPKYVVSVTLGQELAARLEQYSDALTHGNPLRLRVAAVARDLIRYALDRIEQEGINITPRRKRGRR